jgi:lysophospholipase L1-like esterase
LVLAALVVTACAGASATLPSTRPLPARASGVDVFVVGDSISDGAGDQIDRTFASLGWDAARVAIGGQTVETMRPFITYGTLFRRPDVMVIELGTNDMGGLELADDEAVRAPTRSAQLREYARALRHRDEALRDMQQVPCVVWLDVTDWTDLDFGPSGHYDTAEWAPLYNARLREQQQRYANLHVIDYADRLRARGQAWIDANFDQPWRLHPQTAAGKQFVADVMVDAVRSACGA